MNEKTPRLGDRSLFPDLAPRVYANHCAISPPSLPVRAAMRGALDDYATRGVAAFTSLRDLREGLRGRLASLIGAAPTDIAWAPNTTAGVIDIALCLPWRAGDRILCYSGEFPTNVTPWQRAADLFGLDLELLPLDGFSDASGDGLSRLEAALRRGARLVAISAVQFQTGLRMPWEQMAALCHAHGAELFVDAIQAVGAVPLDVRCGIDYLACGGHKWLMGPEGTGFVYVAPERAAALRPHLAGWLSHEEPLGFLFQGAGHLRYDRPLRATADVFESGAQNAVGLAGLNAAVGLLQTLGPPAIFAHAQGWIDALESGLRDRGFESLRATDPAARSCILGALPPEGVTVQSLWSGFAERGVSVSIPDGVLRFGPHWPNAMAEVPAVLAALDELLSGRAR